MKKEEVPVRKGLWDSPIPNVTAVKTECQKSPSANREQTDPPVVNHSGNSQLGCR